MTAVELAIRTVALGTSRLSTRGRRIIRALLVVLAIGPALVYGGAYLAVTAQPGGFEPFADANTYLAAGERLNAGHDLYSIGPGDRSVVYVPGISPAALLSPPPIAAIWRPLAAFPWGFGLWIAACWLALLGTITYLVWKTGPIALVLTLSLAEAIGQQLSVANVAAFFPAILVVSWRYRAHAQVGLLIGSIAAIKLAPASVGGWLVAERRWRALAWCVIAGVALALVGALGAGITSYGRYLEVASHVGPSALSLSGLTGVGSLSYVVLIGGTIVAAGLGRWPRASFAVAVTTFVVGTPALYLSSLVPLLAIAAPLVPDADGRVDVLSRVESYA